MEKASKRKTIVLLSTGIFLISMSLIVSNYYELPDFIKGITFGIGIGLLVRSIMTKNLKYIRK